jgi:hypothetical protein
MRCSAAFSISIATVLGLSFGAAVAQDSAPADGAQRERPVTPRVAAMLAAAVPKFAAATPDTTSPAAEMPRVAPPQQPANQIVRLPSVVVRERRPPVREEILSDAELAKIGMNRYIGPYDGLDRGVLNLFTIKALWNKIPVLGRYDLMGFQTNEERGLRLYKEAKQKEEFENLSNLLSIGSEPDTGPALKRPRKK